MIAALALTAPAGAITYGAPDGNGHPEVGALLAPQAYSDGTWETCSGTLISPTVFLTAAHCDQDVSP
jgi:Trypsin